VDQSRGLQGLATAFLLEPAPGELAKFIVDQWQQFVGPLGLMVDGLE
jgi:hypothetical protein